MLFSNYLPSGSKPSDHNKFPFDHDFILNGKPQKFYRNSKGNFHVASGSIVKTRYGTGIVIDQNKIEITEFINEAARRYVTKKSSAVNNSLMIEIAYWESKRTSEELDITFNKFLKEFIDTKLERLLGENEIEISCDHTDLIEGEVGELLFQEALSPKREEIRKQIRQKASEIVANIDPEDEDDDDYIPSFITEELDEEYGAFGEWIEEE